VRRRRDPHLRDQAVCSSSTFTRGFLFAGEDEHAAQHQGGADGVPEGEGFAQHTDRQHDRHDRRHIADDGGALRADQRDAARDAVGGQHRRHRADRQHQQKAVAGDGEVADRVGGEEVHDDAGAGGAHGDRGEQPRSQPVDQRLGHDLVARISEGGAEHQGGAQHHVLALDAEVMPENQRYAGIRHHQRADHRRSDAAPEEHRTEQHHEERVGEEDQPVELRRDVLERRKIQQACDVVAEHADAERLQQHRQGQRRGGAGRQVAQFAAIAEDADGEEDRYRDDHPPGERRHRVDALAERQLDDDALGGKQRRAEQREHDAGPGKVLEAGSRRGVGRHGAGPVVGPASRSPDTIPRLMAGPVSVEGSDSRRVPVPEGPKAGFANN